MTFRAAAALLLATLLCQCAAMPRRTSTPELLAGGRWRAGDGKELSWHEWPGAPRGKEAQAVLVLVHGFGGAAESDFWPLGEKLPPQRYALYGLDLRGMGKDPDTRRRGDIASGQQWVDDLLEFSRLAAARHPGRPVIWYGESLGALIALQAATRPGADRPEGLVLASPPVELRQKLPTWKMGLLRTAMAAMPRLRLSPQGLDRETVKNMQVTSTTTHQAQADKTPHTLKSCTLRFYREIETLIRASQPAAPRLHAPLLVLYTAHDPLVTREAVEAWSARVASHRKTAHFFPASYHLILHDTERWDAIDKLAAWLKERTAGQ